MGLFEEPFTYGPLVDNQSNIRVVRVLEDTSGSIRLMLAEAELKDCHHICLSYMWGSENSQKTIQVNGKPFKVRRNLYDFLKLARDQSIFEWLWIDAICINQLDDEERCDQVRIMGQIYSLAKYVLIYSGITPDIAALRDDTLKSRVETPTEHTCFFNKIGFGGLHGMRHDTQNVVPFHVPMRHALFNTPYWSRMWIIQELVLAKRAYIVTRIGLLCWMCAMAEFDQNWTTAIQPRKLAKLLYAKGALKLASSIPFARSSAQTMQSLGTRRSATTTLAQLHLEHKQGYNEPEAAEGEVNVIVRTAVTGIMPYQAAIFGLLTKLRAAGYQCTKKNDAVYALLGFLQPAPSFPIDYDRRTSVLALDLLDHFYPTYKGLMWDTEEDRSPFDTVVKLCEDLGTKVRVLCSEHNAGGFREDDTTFTGNNMEIIEQFSWVAYDKEDKNEFHHASHCPGCLLDETTFHCVICGFDVKSEVEGIGIRFNGVLHTRIHDRELAVAIIRNYNLPVPNTITIQSSALNMS